MLLGLWNEFDGVEPLYNREWLVDKIKAVNNWGIPELSIALGCVIELSLLYYFFHTQIFLWNSLGTWRLARLLTHPLLRLEPASVTVSTPISPTQFVSQS